MDQKNLRLLVRAALKEDLGVAGDVTSRSVLSPDAKIRARIVAREPGVLAGIQIAARAFKECDPKIRVRVLKKDGQKFRRGDTLLEVQGQAIPVLSAERTALNFLRHLTGVATLTGKFVEKTKGTRAKIYDTRKTTPLLRDLEKYAVTCGGGKNHRRGLYDAVLIKDNHVAAAGSVRKAVRQARTRLGRSLPIQVECDTIQEVREALAAGADLLLCDNMPPPLLRRIVQEVKGKIPVEASGGVNLKTVRPIAKTGVDRISVGAITHSAPQIDLALDYAGKKKARKSAPKSHPSQDSASSKTF